MVFDGWDSVSARVPKCTRKIDFFFFFLFQTKRRMDEEQKTHRIRHRYRAERRNEYRVKTGPRFAAGGAVGDDLSVLGGIIHVYERASLAAARTLQTA